MHSHIIATQLAVPAARQTAAELAELLQCDEGWIHQNVGVSQRFLCRLGDDPAELAAQAGRAIVDRVGPPDLLIYSSATVRQCIPDTSVFVARQLGLSGIPSFSLNATCLSFLVALENASALIERGTYRRVLIVSAEFPTLSRNLADPESAALFGDGAAAAMVEACDRPAGVLHYQQTTWPELAELAQVRGGGLLRHPLDSATRPEDYLFEMDGIQLLKTTFPKLKGFLQSFLAAADISLDQISLVIPHQASAAGLKLLQKCGFPADRIVNILADYGNCVSASLPMALAVADAEGRLRRDDHLLLIGTAAGLSIGAAMVKW